MSAPSPNTPDPHTPGAADGQRSTPSDPAAGAKTNGPHAIDGQGGDKPEEPYRDGSQAVTDRSDAGLDIVTRHEGIAS